MLFIISSKDDFVAGAGAAELELVWSIAETRKPTRVGDHREYISWRHLPTLIATDMVFDVNLHLRDLNIVSPDVQSQHV